jgi:hypothetical protein
MLQNDSARTRTSRSTVGRVALALVLAATATTLSTSCEDKGLGRPCGDIKDATALQSAYTVQASDCPSHICTKPGVEPGVSTDLDTGAYCTITCSSDDDCNGQTRDPSNKLDTRCRKGFVCATPFDTGSLCCKKVCLCRDFFLSSVGPATPDLCKSDAGASCK